VEHADMNPADAEPAAQLERSLELAVERIGDPTARVYHRLFELAPDLEPLFAGDRSGSVRAEMLQRALETVTDLLRGAPYAHGLIATEQINHAQFGVPPARFGLFLVAVADVLRDALGTEWDGAIASAWQTVLARADAACGAAQAAG
jgi:hemoglobin-like flavoprotein